MKLSRRLAVNLVVVLLLGLLAIGWAVVELAGSSLVGRPFRVAADFASSGGVFTGQEVTYRGVLVGKVGRLSLNDDGVNIELLIEREWDGEIPSDVVASVQSKSAVGEQFVNLTPISEGSDMLADGDTIPRERTELPVDFQELLVSLDRVLADVPPERAGRLVRNLADGLGGRGEEIATILRSLGTLSDAFASVAPEQKRLLSSATRAGRAFLATKDEFAAAIRAADEVFAGIGDEPEELERLLETNDRLAREGLELLTRHGLALERGIEGLADFVSFQLEQRREIEKTLTYLPQFLHAIEDASIPWRSPDGRRFYRIRAGLVLDNVPATWPCKYKLPFEYERYHFERKAREPVTSLICRKSNAQSTVLADELVAAVSQWAAESQGFAVPSVSTRTTEESELIWPLSGTITSGFGPRDDGFHAGIDIGTTAGTTVGAAAAGRVTSAGFVEDYGNVVVIDNGDGTSTAYAHLGFYSVFAGQSVAQGQALGGVGCTGNCTGPHLHFELRVRGIPIDPIPYLPPSGE
jgi:virulence factor Mce-like protein